jgi:multiple sugar transport system permease protein
MTAVTTPLAETPRAPEVAPIKRRAPRRKRLVVLYVVLLVSAFVSIFPFLIAVFTAFKPTSGLFSSPVWLPTLAPTFANFLTVVTKYGFLQYLGQTIVYAALVTAGQLVFSTFAAYAFARMKFPGRDLIFWLYLATLLVPNVVTMIPLFIMMKDLGWVNTYAGLAAPWILGTPLGVFLMRQFFRGIPDDLEDAARVDGANVPTLLWRIILPLSRPILATLAIITGVQAWNNLLWPLIISSTSNTRMVTVAIADFQSNFGTDWNLMMAAAVIALLPPIIFFLIFQRQIVRSIVLTGLK